MTQAMIIPWFEWAAAAEIGRKEEPYQRKSSDWLPCMAGQEHLLYMCRRARSTSYTVQAGQEHLLYMYRILVFRSLRTLWDAITRACWVLTGGLALHGMLCRFWVDTWPSLAFRYNC